MLKTSHSDALTEQNKAGEGQIALLRCYSDNSLRRCSVVIVDDTAEHFAFVHCTTTGGRLPTRERRPLVYSLVWSSPIDSHWVRGRVCG